MTSSAVLVADDLNQEEASLDQMAETGELMDPQVGNWVVWYPPNTSLNGQTVPAVITRVNADKTLSLSAAPLDSPYFVAPDGSASVPHASQEDLIRMRNGRNGCWDYMPQEKHLRQILIRLVERVKALEVPPETSEKAVKSPRS